MKHAHHFTACALLAAAAMLTTACSSGEADIEPKPAEPKEQPADTPSTIHFTATLAPKGDDDALTRAVDSKGVTKWVRGEQIAVYYQTANGPTSTTVSVESVNDGFATISGELPNAVAGDAKFVYPASLHNGQGGINEERLLNNQNGLLKSYGISNTCISSDFDAATADGKIIIDGNDATVSGTVTMENQVCICMMKLYFNDGQEHSSEEQVKGGNTLTITVGNSRTYTITSANSVDASQTGSQNPTYRPFQTGDLIYVAMLPVQSETVVFESISDDGYRYRMETTGTLEAGKFYTNVPIALTIPIRVLPSDAKDLSKGDITAFDGDYISQSILNPTSHTITIQNGATVTIDGVDINGNSIVCEGEATIILRGKNVVIANELSPAIKVGTMLTIMGNGSLNVTGGKYGAGIGSEVNGTCGDITISGGTVEAWGGFYAAGIGSGQGGRCGNITINNTVTKVTAWHNGTSHSCCIGRGEGGSCGKVKIGDTVYDNGIFDISFTYQPGN